MPEALFVDIKDDAQRRKTSINAEIVRRCMLRRWSNQRDRELGLVPDREAMRRELMALEPGPDDPRTDQEIARQMQAVHDTYEPRGDHDDDADDHDWRSIPQQPTREDMLEVIQELPGSQPF
jgi:hypothetical protein